MGKETETVGAFVALFLVAGLPQPISSAVAIRIKPTARYIFMTELEALCLSLIQIIVAALRALHRRAGEYRLYVPCMNGLEDLQRLRAFVRIVECGSISAAARTLSATQPTLSRQLRQLERATGV